MQQFASADLQLQYMSDEEMRSRLTTLREYTVAILKRGAEYAPPRSNPIIFEHGRRNAALRAAGLLSIVCPIPGDTEVAGIGIFSAGPGVVESIMLGDPAIRTHVLEFEVHPGRSFPGDALPGAAPAQQTRVTEMPPELPTISDEYMSELLAGARNYTVRILKHGPRHGSPGADAIIWEHGRRNLALRAAGVLAISCPIRDSSAVSGVGIFNRDAAEVITIMNGDPAVEAGVLTFEVHPAQSFPGDCLP